MQYHATPCNTMQYYAIQCNTMQYHASLITADGAYHCPVGSIKPFLSWYGNQYAETQWKMTKIDKKTMSYRVMACVCLLLANTKGSNKREKLFSRAAWNIENRVTFFHPLLWHKCKSTWTVDGYPEIDFSSPFHACHLTKELLSPLNCWESPVCGRDT